MDLQTSLQEYTQALNLELYEVAERFLPGPPELDRMLRYQLGWVDECGTPIHARAGKQIRPTLVLLSTEAACGEWRKALPAAAAIELLHNFSLIHDDIEDDSPLRRGRSTLWRIWGVPAAINAGDAMFALAHRVLRGLVERGVQVDRVLDAAALFDRASLALTSGQHMDMLFEKQQTVSVEQYLEMIGNKSAALLAASVQMGAVIAGLDSELIQHYYDFGYNLGLAFQIRDDILGIWGDPEETGKSAATDIIARKKSLPVLYGLSQSSEFVEMYSRPNVDDEDVSSVVAVLDLVGALEFSRKYEQQFYERAQVLLDLMGLSGGVGGMLVELSGFLLGRSV